MKKLGIADLVENPSTDLYRELVLKLMNQVLQSFTVPLHLLKADVYLETRTQFTICTFRNT